MMVAFNFKKQFADDVETGRKPHTIRAPRKTDRKGLSNGQPCREGEKLQLYTGMRTKQCRKLRDEVCLFVVPICMFEEDEKYKISTGFIDGSWVCWNNYIMTDMQAMRLAKSDGFESLEAMARWFDETHGLPFRGYLIGWKPD